MAKKYCDHGAYGAYAAVPNWGQAQDGDGTAKTVGTPSVAEVVFTGIASTGVIAVLGQTITFTRTTDANTCANNLAAAINASTAVATGPSSFTTLSQVRNHLYARGPASGAPAGTCQIMTRQASAEHAGLICATHTLNNVSSPATITFSGGSGGCWGYLFNNSATVWASGIAIGGYGLLTAATAYTGSLSGGDKVVVRSGKTIAVPNGSTVTCSTADMGSRDAPVLIEVDDGTEWTEDGANPYLSITAAHTSSFSFAIVPKVNSFVVISGKEYAAEDYSLRFLESGSGFTGSGIYLPYGGPAVFQCYRLEVVSGTSDVFWVNTAIQSPHSGGHTRFVLKTPRTSNFVRGQYQTGLGSAVDWSCGVIDNTGNSTPHASIFSGLGGDGFGSQYQLTFSGVEFRGFVTGSRLLPTDYSATAVPALVFRDCDFGGVTIRGPVFSATAANINRAQLGAKSVTISGTRGLGDFAFEHARGFVEWNSQLSFPTAKARLLDGLTPWSIRAQPTSVAANICATAPLELPRISKINTLPSGSRTFSVDLAIEDSLAWTKASVSLTVQYVDTSGRIREVSSYDNTGAALDVSTETWSQESGVQVTFSNGGTIYHNKRKITLTTPPDGDVASGCTINCYVRIHVPVTTAVQSVFVDPEVTVV